MRISLSLLVGMAIVVPSVCHAQMKCPWINEATARGILGGDVTLTAKVNDRSEGVCEFSRQQGVAVRQLVVSVNIMTDISKQFRTYLAQCPPKSDPIRAIGNEAVTCTSQGKGHSSAEIVVGRVRDQAFVVSLSSSVGDDPSMTQEMRRQKVNLVAEQIAGILF